MSQNDKTDTFGKRLRSLRQKTTDPDRGRMITQERFGELIGMEMGDGGYTGAAVSDWERDKSKINAADRGTLLGILAVLAKSGGLSDPAGANALLHLGDYRGLNAEELRQLFGIEPDEAVSLQQLPQVEQLSRDRRRQLILLEKVRRYWLEGVLESSRPDNDFIELHGRITGQVTQATWDGLQRTQGEDQIVLSRPELQTLFDGVGRHLLLLGAPGSGKTTVLLQLAETLWQTALQNEEAPVPVVLHLSSWSAEQKPLHEWILDELAAKYHIPVKIGATWLENEQILMLLDGFDRVPPALRSKCAITINEFRKAYGLVDFAVCSRLQEYEEARIRLDLGAAVEISSLQSEQISGYLTQSNGKNGQLLDAILDNERINALVQSPLMLRIVQSVYGRSENGEVPGNGVVNEQDLLGAYVAHRLDGEASSAAEIPANIRRILSWLAANMKRHNQNQFLQELLQPSWLSLKGWQWLYLLITRLWDGFVIAIVLWLLLQQYRVANPDIPVAPSQLVAGWLDISLVRAEFVILFVGNVLLSLLIAIVHAAQFDTYKSRALDLGRRSRNRQRALQLLAVGLVVTVVTTVAMLAIAAPQLAAIWGVIEGVVFVIFARYIHGRSYTTEVRTVEALSWSWLNAAKGASFGFLAAVFTEVVETLYLTENGYWQSITTYMIVGFLLGGLNGYRIQSGERSNQGIWLAAYNALLAAAITTPIVGVVSGLIWGAESGILTALIMFISSLALFGGSNIVKHLIIRGLLWFDRKIPLRLTAVLDEATQIALLRRVGGSYIFIHDLLLEWFAARDE